MEQRTKPPVKAQFQKAAALERARATIADQERTLLSAEAYKTVLAALESPPEPTEALREAMALHRAHMPDGG